MSMKLEFDEMQTQADLIDFDASLALTSYNKQTSFIGRLSPWLVSYHMHQMIH